METNYVSDVNYASEFYVRSDIIIQFQCFISLPMRIFINVYKNMDSKGNTTYICESIYTYFMV